MKVLYINNDGGGFADYIELNEGVTVEAFFSGRVTGKPNDYLIRVNRLPVPSSQVLQEGDRISFTPTKIEGAAASTSELHSPRAIFLHDFHGQQQFALIAR